MTSNLRKAYQELLKRHVLRDNTSHKTLIEKLSDLSNSVSDVNSTLNKDSACRGIYIYGGVGTGKSRCMDLFYTTMKEEETVSIRRAHFHEFMLSIHTSLHKMRSSPLKKAGYSTLADPLPKVAAEIVKRSQVLCLDEMQVTDIVDAAVLSRLFSSIWKEGGVTVFTSNRHPTSLYERGLNRKAVFEPFVNLLCQKCDIVEVTGEDYRQSKAVSLRSSWFVDCAEYQRDIETSTVGKQFTSSKIKVMMGRTITVLTARPTADGKSIFKTNYHELCLLPKGASDYHALLSAASKVYISDVPKFKKGEQGGDLNGLRRFITFVDIAYELRVSVTILSSTSFFDCFSNFVTVHDSSTTKEPSLNEPHKLEDLSMSVKGKGGSSSSLMSTFIGEMEWSATGLPGQSLASIGGGAEGDVEFAVGRCVSRLWEMGGEDWTQK